MKYYYTQGTEIKEIESTHDIDFLERRLRTNLIPADKSVQETFQDLIPEGYKLDAGDMKFIPLTIEESFKLNEITKEQYNKIQEQLRAGEYLEVSDPLFFQVEAGEIDRAVWIKSRADVKFKFAYKK